MPAKPVTPSQIKEVHFAVQTLYEKLEAVKHQCGALERDLSLLLSQAQRLPANNAK